MGHLTRIANAVVRNLERGPAHTPVGEVIRGEPCSRCASQGLGHVPAFARGLSLRGAWARVHSIPGQFTAQACPQEMGQLLMPAGPSRTLCSCTQSVSSRNSGGFGDLPSTRLGAEAVAPVPWTRPGAEPYVA